VKQIKEKEPITITNPNMTRFMMTLDDSIKLVLYAFKNSKPGDIFVQKAPSSTVANIVQALKEMYNANSEIRIIGTRHGEKLFETLVNREERVKAIELKNYFRIPINPCDLNYNKYFSEGESKILEVEEYTSNNTRRLNVEQTKEMLLKVDFIRNDVKGKK